MADLWPLYQRVASPAEGQNAEPGDRVQKMYECVYATVSVVLQAYRYPDTEPTDLMNMVHPGGHVGGEDFAVVADFLRSHPQRWPNLPTITVSNPADTLAEVDRVLNASYGVVMDVKDDRNAQPVAQWPAGWEGTHAVILLADDSSSVTIWNPWQGAPQKVARDFFRLASLNPAGNFMTFNRSLLSKPTQAADALALKLTDR